jgi:tetratricopeptide (TPR) repeat protein
MKKLQIIFLLFNLVFINQIFSHGDIHDRIIEVTKEIKVSPDSAYLFFKRGKLYFQHEDYSKSIKDLYKSEALGYRSIEQKLLFAKAYNGLDELDKAISFCDLILVDDARNVRALQVKAQSLVKQGKFYFAALQFEKVIEFSNEIFPENFIDASKAWELLNSDDGYKQATLIIIKGI